MVNAGSKRGFLREFPRFLRVFARFLRSQNPFKYIRSFNVYHKIARRALSMPDCVQIIMCNYKILAAFTFQKGAFAYICALKKNAGATQKMQPVTKNRVKTWLSSSHPAPFSQGRAGGSPLCEASGRRAKVRP